MISTLPLKNKNRCAYCSKKVQCHKSAIKCTLCDDLFHPKCAKLQPDDLNKPNLVLLNSWTCSSCMHNIFPLFLLDLGNSELKSTKPPTRSVTRQNCHTCSKLGNVLEECDLCGIVSHPRCFAGLLGCKKCARDIFPGFDVKVQELFALTGHNNLVFNPFSCDNDIHNIGVADREEGGFEQQAWSACSGVLQHCNYCELCSITSSRPYELKVMSLNIRSIHNKIATIRDHELKHYSKFSVLCFNETCCSVDTLPFGGTELELEGFYPPIIQRPSRTSGRGGGLCIYINTALCSDNDFRVLENLSDHSDPANGEFLFVEIDRKRNKNIIIGNMYRSPSFPPGPFIDNLGQKLDTLKRYKNKNIVLVSDSNIDLLKHDSFEPANQLVDLYAEHGFIPTISRPTHITEHSATLIDHIFVNNCEAITKSGIITTDVSDHLAPYVNLLIDSTVLNKAKNNSTTRSNENFRQMSEENLANFKTQISGADWGFINRCDSADTKFELFESKYREIYDNCFPMKCKLKKKRKFEKPWLLPWLSEACDRKNKCYIAFVKCPTTINKTKYLKYKRFVAKHIRKAKSKYYESYFKRYADDGRKQWSMINELLNRKPRRKNNISKLIHKDNTKTTTITEPHEIANRFNDYFCNIAQRLKEEDGHLGDRGRPPESTLNYSERSILAMPETSCTVTEIEKYISDLKNKATSNLAILPFKSVSKEIAPIIQHLLQASFTQGIFPSNLKCAKVIPLYKSGSRSEISNYRPISLLSCFSKIYERAMQKKLVNFFDTHNKFFGSQFGFRSGHSCEHALLEAQSKICRSLDNKEVAVLLLIDFSKAFDMVDHEIMIKKLEHYGVRGKLLSWFQSYLTNRQQYVHLNGVDSNKKFLKYGVPQGSILGPLLFIIYINDLPEITNLAKYIFFADDANILVTGQDLSEINIKIKTVITAIELWVKSNGLKLNIKKTKYMVFSNKRNLDYSVLQLSLNGNPIEHSNSERFLGVIVDSSLNWKTHISGLKSKISRNAGILYRLKGIVPNNVLKLVYNSLIQSHMNYCSNVWGLGSKSSISSIFCAQKKAIRAVGNGFNNNFYNPDTGELPCHTKEIFAKNKLLTVYNLIAKNCLTAMHRVYQQSYPTPILELFNANHDPDYTMRRDPEYFEIPRSRLVALDRTLAFRGPMYYNAMVNSINKEHKIRLERKYLNAFKSIISHHLLEIQGSGGEEWSAGNFALHG